jgi:non-ribosomal peptide synthetase-like protein
MEKSILIGPNLPELIREETLAAIFRESAKSRQSEIALTFHQTSVSYEALDRWTDSIAAFLSLHKIEKGMPVGVWLPRGLELHATILGIVKAGASYVPVDYEIPPERIQGILSEVGAVACFTDKPQPLPCQVFIPLPQNTPFDAKDVPVDLSPNNWAYVLYTSGSTGKPKGIPITQRQICHLVRAEQSIFKIKPEDKVYQGFSVSFDMWCEETWIAYLAGASLWVADSLTAKSIDELSAVLEREKISILHAVPSLLAAMEKEVPAIRLVNSGGEACTAKALQKWANNGRLFYNSYGPTETTVTATMAKLHAGDVISIGNVLPNYSLAVVDENFNPVAKGSEGELVIAGIGVANGYINRPELSKEKFINKPASLPMLYGERVYRTGDVVSINDKDAIEFCGRIDDQVKLHGYRIELGEIESQLSLLPGIKEVAVCLKKDAGKQEQLVAYLQVEKSFKPDEHAMRQALAKNLPVYMLPSCFIVLEDLPRLASGKINRKELTALEFNPVKTTATEQEPLKPNASIAEKVIYVIKQVLHHPQVSLEQDFFNDLGGHSFLAANFVSELRDKAGIPNASLKDVYMHRPLNKLVAFWEERTVAQKQEKELFNHIHRWHYVCCGIAQTAALLLIYALFAMQLFLPFLGYSYVFASTKNHLYGIVTAFSLYCLIIPLFFMISILVKWLVIGKMREGDYPLWGSYYFRWWFVKSIQKLASVQFLSDTPLYPIYLRCLGVKIGSNAQFSALKIGAEDLVTMGKDVSISSHVVLDNAYIENGWLKLRTIHLGDHAYLGSSAVVGPGVIMGNWSDLQDLSSVLPNQVIRPKEMWQGSPAKKVKTKTVDELVEPLHVSSFTKTAYSFLFTIILLLFPLAILIPLLPTIVVLNEQNHSITGRDFTYLVITPILALLYVLIFLVQTIIGSRVLQYKIKPGVYKVYSLLYVRKWLSDQFMGLSLSVLHPIYATVYVSAMFRAFGAKIGKKTEISTASGITHPLLEIGDGGFVADAATLGESDVRGLRFTLKKTIIRNMSFVGNGAVIPQGYELNSNMLIGVLSTPPSPEQLEGSTAKDWFGSPSIALPRRQATQTFPDSLTLNPGWKRILARGFVEFMRVIIPTTMITLFSILFLSFGHDLIVGRSLWEIVLLFPFYYLAIIGIPCFLFALALKWIVIGKYRSEQLPMWTWKVWKSEAITTTFESLAVPYLLDFLTGTFWLPVAFRMMGVKIGKRVCMNTTDITEYDVVSIGDDSVLNDDSGPQTHLFEDRIMKIGSVSIGKRCSIGARTIILYDSKVEDDANILPLSLVMKGETISGNKNWVGSPVRLQEL